MSERMAAVMLEVNGERVHGSVPVRQSLADYLRDDLGLTGTRLGCEHGVCGACTVVVDGGPARSCLMLAVQADGSSVTTIEGLARSGAIDRLRDAFARRYAAQCGFCTSGMLVSAYCALATEAEADEKQVRDWLSGNLCRCTGYASIVDAVLEVLTG